MIQKSRKFKKPGFQQTILFSIIISFLLLGAISFLIISNWKINQRRQELTSKIEALKKEIEVLEVKNAELKTKISQSQQESYLEKEARERLGLKKPGEEVVAVLPAEEKKEEQPQEKSLWQKILDPIKIFFRRD